MSDDTKIEQSLQSKSRRLSPATINQRKTIIGFIQDSSVTSYDIGQFMDFDKVKCNNMLRAMEEDGLIKRDGVADAHPSGKGRPPFLWKLVDATFWAKMHGNEPENSEGGNEVGDTTPEVKTTATTEEKPTVEPERLSAESTETVPSTDGTSPAVPSNVEAKANGTAEPSTGTNTNTPEAPTPQGKKQPKTPEEKAKSIQDRVNQKIAEKQAQKQAEKDADKKPQPQGKTDTKKAATTTASKSAAPEATSTRNTRNVHSVQTVIVFSNNAWVAATAENIKKYTTAFADNQATALDVPLGCSDISKYVVDHSEELVF